MTIKEIAKLENTSIQTVRNWVYLGKLASTRTIYGYYISDNDYKEFCAKCESGEIERKRK